MIPPVLQRVSNPEQVLANKLSQSTRSVHDVSILREAWLNPCVHELVVRSILDGNFKNIPALGAVFVQKIDELCKSSLNEEEIYEELKLFFNELTKDSELHRGFQAERTERVERRIKQVRELLGDYMPKSLLDIGCGSGDITNDIKNAFVLPNQRVFGLEVVTGENKHPFEILEFNGSKIPLPDKSFDLVVLFTVLHHAENPELLLADIHRVLEDTGYLIVREFDAFSYELKLFNLVMDHMLYKVYSPSPDVPIPGRYLGLYKWHEMFSQTGFRVKNAIFNEGDNPTNPYRPFMLLLEKNL